MLFIPFFAKVIFLQTLERISIRKFGAKVLSGDAFGSLDFVSDQLWNFTHKIQNLVLLFFHCFDDFVIN